jgi:hypothetical protein
MPNPALKSERVFETTKGQERKVTTWPMSTRKRRITIPQLVKRVDLTREYPGYRYVYFETYAELDAYFTGKNGLRKKLRRKQDGAKFNTKKTSRMNKFIVKTQSHLHLVKYQSIFLNH